MNKLGIVYCNLKEYQNFWWYHGVGKVEPLRHSFLINHANVDKELIMIAAVLDLEYSSAK